MGTIVEEAKLRVVMVNVRIRVVVASVGVARSEEGVSDKGASEEV